MATETHMNFSTELSPHYQRPVAVAAAGSALLLVLSAMVLDGVASFLSSFCAIAAFWAGTILIITRRPQVPTKMDIDVIRFGPITIVIAAQFLVRGIGYMKGVPL